MPLQEEVIFELWFGHLIFLVQLTLFHLPNGGFTRSKQLLLLLQKLLLEKSDFLPMKVEATLPLPKEDRILQFTKDERLASFQWCLLRIAHNYPLLITNKMLSWQNYQSVCFSLFLLTSHHVSRVYWFIFHFLTSLDVWLSMLVGMRGIGGDGVLYLSPYLDYLLSSYLDIILFWYLHIVIALYPDMIHLKRLHLWHIFGPCFTFFFALKASDEKLLTWLSLYWESTFCVCVCGWVLYVWVMRNYFASVCVCTRDEAENGNWSGLYSKIEYRKVKVKSEKCQILEG